MPAHAVYDYAVLYLMHWGGRALLIVSFLYVAYVLLMLLRLRDRQRKIRQLMVGLFGGLVFTSSPFGVLLYALFPSVNWITVSMQAQYFILGTHPIIRANLSWLPAFAVGFFCANLVLPIVDRWRRPSNNTVDADARKDGAHGSP